MGVNFFGTLEILRAQMRRSTVYMQLFLGDDIIIEIAIVRVTPDHDYSQETIMKKAKDVIKRKARKETVGDIIKRYREAFDSSGP